MKKSLRVRVKPQRGGENVVHAPWAAPSHDSEIVEQEQRPTKPADQWAHNQWHARKTSARGLVGITADDVEADKTPAYCTTYDYAERRPATVTKVVRHKTKGHILKVSVRLEDTGDEIVAVYDKKTDAFLVPATQVEPNLGKHGRCICVCIGKRMITNPVG